MELLNTGAGAHFCLRQVQPYACETKLRRGVRHGSEVGICEVSSAVRWRRSILSNGLYILRAAWAPDRGAEDGPAIHPTDALKPNRALRCTETPRHNRKSERRIDLDLICIHVFISLYQDYNEIYYYKTHFFFTIDKM